MSTVSVFFPKTNYSRVPVLWTLKHWAMRARNTSRAGSTRHELPNCWFSVIEKSWRFLRWCIRGKLLGSKRPNLGLRLTWCLFHVASHATYGWFFADEDSRPFLCLDDLVFVWWSWWTIATWSCLSPRASPWDRHYELVLFWCELLFVIINYFHVIGNFEWNDVVEATWKRRVVFWAPGVARPPRLWCEQDLRSDIFAHWPTSAGQMVRSGRTRCVAVAVCGFTLHVSGTQSNWRHERMSEIGGLVSPLFSARKGE